MAEEVVEPVAGGWWHSRANRISGMWVTLVVVGLVMLFQGWAFLAGMGLVPWPFGAIVRELQVVPIGDLNDDGLDDVVVRTADRNSASFTRQRLRAYSGRDGSILRTYAFHTELMEIGGVTDIDGDGAEELLVGDFRNWVVLDAESGAVELDLHLDREWSVSWWYAYVFGDADLDGCDDVVLRGNRWEIRSLRDGRVIHPSSHDLLVPLGDLDGDGHPDFAAMPWLDGLRSRPDVSCEVRSGRSGPTLFRFDVRSGSAIPLRLAGDVDGDGARDLYALTKDGWSLLSGRDGRSLGITYGEHETWIGDVDGDGSPDFAASGESGELWVDVRSGRSDARLLSYRRPRARWLSKLAVSGVGDLDGDGRSDFALALDSDEPPGDVFVFSGATGDVVCGFDVETGGVDLATCPWERR